MAQDMESKKGKERAQPENHGSNNASPSGKGDETSLLSKIASSASGLTNSAFAAPTTNELNETTRAALTNSGKGTSFGGSGNQYLSTGESSKQTQQSLQGQALREGIRDGHNAEHISKTEQEFSSFFDGTDTFMPSAQTVGDGPENGVDEAFEYAWIRSRAGRHDPNEIQASTSMEMQESQDGEAVLAILSGQNGEYDQFELPLEDEELALRWNLSSHELAQLGAFPGWIYTPFEPHSTISRNNPLNLTAGFEDHTMVRPDTTQQSPLARDHWQDQWEGVLTRYTDEVWGDLLPLVKEARKEVKDMQRVSVIDEEPKTLRRLRGILAHLQQP
jgi:hypothetical protein